MARNDRSNETAPSFKTRVVRVVILTGVTVVFGYGGWIVLTLTASVAGYDSKTEDGDLLRNRLLDWPERNRDAMRSNGHESLPVKP